MMRRGTRGAIAAAIAATTWATTAATGGNSPFQEVVAADQPILWYRFNEARGATQTVNHGSLGAAYDGVLVNGVTLGVPTLGGDTGASFDAALQQYVESLAVVPASLTGNPTFTAETIVFIDADFPGARAFGYPPFLHWGAPTTGKSVYFSLYKHTNDRVYAGFYNGGLRSIDTVRTGSFHHIVWTRVGGGGQYDGSIVYVDGTPIDLEPDTTLPGAPVIDVTATTFRVQRATDSVRYFTGVVDEIVLYDRVLTPQEVTEHFLAALIPPDCPADFDGDGAVGPADLATLLGAWTGGDPYPNCPGYVNTDLDQNCHIDPADLAILLSQWGECP